MFWHLAKLTHTQEDVLNEYEDIISIASLV